MLVNIFSYFGDAVFDLSNQQWGLKFTVACASSLTTVYFREHANHPRRLCKIHVE